MIFGVTFGGGGGSGSTSQQSGSAGSGSQYQAFGSQMSDVSISFEYGICDIKRAYMLAELFQVDGWYIPGEKAGSVSDGTVGGQVNDDVHFLPMITTQFLVVRNVKITASNWGDAGKSMSAYSSKQKSTGSSDYSSASAAVGFLCFGGEASHQEGNYSGSNVYSQANAAAWGYNGNAEYGILEIPGAQIVGYVGEILPNW